ncbi:MAG: hypothetical protein PVG07_15540 [Acidobacteriota bacterium]|jgi:hypothetical protein
MSRSLQRTLAVAAIALVAFAGGLLLQADARAQGAEDAEILVGTYQPQQVAQATNFQQKMMQQMQGLQQRAQQAQQEQDQAALQQIQQEAQQMQQDAANQFLADIEAVMPQVAESTGAQIIATDVTYTADGIATQDVTQAIIDAMNTNAGSGDAMGEDSMEDESMSEGEDSR